MPLVDSLPSYMTGGLPGRSIKNNSVPHLEQDVVVGLDIENCFPSISHKQVFGTFRKLGYSTDIASMLTKLTTYQNRLPQGAPTSPLLCNLVLWDSAERISLLASKKGCFFTIYIDDV